MSNVFTRERWRKKCTKNLLYRMKRVYRRVTLAQQHQQVKDKTTVFIPSRTRKIDRTPADTEVVMTRIAGSAVETVTRGRAGTIKEDGNINRENPVCHKR
jgi:hypothetical protein